MKLTAKGCNLWACIADGQEQQGSQVNPTIHACETIVDYSGPGAYFPNKELDTGREVAGNRVR